MDFETFKASAANSSSVEPPGDCSPPLAGLWLDAVGNWDGAHRAVQADDGAEAAWVHAYLHRKEGDLSNAGYWYRRASKPPAEGSLESEWEALARTLLEHAAP